MSTPERYECPICGMDGFEDQADLDIHMDDCVDINDEDFMHDPPDEWNEFH